MNPSLDLSYMLESSKLIKNGRTPKDVFMHLVEEVGEVSTALHRPDKADEPLIGELADIMNCTLDLYYIVYGEDYGPLNDLINEKCAKWRSKVGVEV